MQTPETLIVIHEVNVARGYVYGRTGLGERVEMWLNRQPVLTAIPVVGEVWAAERRGMDWVLVRKVETGNELTPLSAMQPGDYRLESPGTLHLNAQTVMINGQPYAAGIEPEPLVEVKYNNVLVSERRGINFIQGDNMVVEVADDQPNNEIDVAFSLPAQITSEAFILAKETGGSEYSVYKLEFDGATVSEASDIATIVIAQQFPTGAILPYSGSSAPTGFLICDGSAVSRTTYAALNALYSADSYPYGNGDGSTTFNLPSILGRAPMGLDSGQSEFNVLGETGGAKTVTLTTSQMPVHSHGLSGGGTHSHTFSGTPYVVGGTFEITGGGANNVSSSGFSINTGGSHSHTIDNAGSGSSHNNLQPYIALPYIVKI